MADILTRQEFDDYRTTDDSPEWFAERVPATVEALARFARASEEYWASVKAVYDAARKVLEEAGWLE